MGVVNAREVARASGLGLLWVDGERVAVNVGIGDRSVVLVGLDKTEVLARTLLETGLVVQEQHNGINGIATIQTRVVEAVNNS